MRITFLVGKCCLIIFICGLINNAVTSSDNILASRDGMASQKEAIIA